MRFALLALVLLATPALAAPQPLAFTVDEDTYTVPDGGLTKVETVDKSGLSFCMTPEVEAALADFTSAHQGETVEVTIGETSVFHLQIVTPYDGGCITWPLHPMVANSYRGLLTGEGTQ